jgi:hypothetical protein
MIVRDSATVTAVTPGTPTSAQAALRAEPAHAAMRRCGIPCPVMPRSGHAQLPRSGHVQLPHVVRDSGGQAHSRRLAGRHAQDRRVSPAKAVGARRVPRGWRMARCDAAAPTMLIITPA